MPELDRDNLLDSAGAPISWEDAAARITLEEPGIVCIRELPNGSYDTTAVMVEEAHRYANQFENVAIVIDITETPERPKGRRKEKIMELLDVGALHFAFVQSTNVLFRSVLRFFIARMEQQTSVHKSVEDAFATARRAIEEAGGAGEKHD